MNTYIKHTYIFYLILIVLFIQSCDQPSTTFSTGENNLEEVSSIDFSYTPELKNNTLSFDSNENFGKFMKEISSIDTDLVALMEKQVNFTTSLHRAQNEVLYMPKSDKDNGGDESIEEIVPDPYFASILNEDGVVEVGGTVYEVGKKFVYVYEDWQAYESYSGAISNSKNSSAPHPQKSTEDEDSIQLEQINDSVYRIEIQGSKQEALALPPPPDGGGGGGGNPGGGDDWCCNSKVTKKYRSGGKDGRLLGESWDINYGLYSSFGSKSKHQRKGPLGVGWVARKADRIWLDSETVFGYKRTMYPVADAIYNELTTLGNVSYSQIEAIFNQAAAKAPNPGQATGSVTNLSNGHNYEVTVKITDWFSSTGGMQVQVKNALVNFSHSKSEANTVKKVYNRDTIHGTISTDDDPDLSLAQKFDVQYIDGFHKLLHDGHTREFQTRKGNID